ncbi:acylphosphatase [Evansella sp. AB-rgal1]|uniref:acylphosphatase n=1 Tax=Evansella sp. AB-rgal1 TaxID=3242696 RepID=UPI00359D242E
MNRVHGVVSGRVQGVGFRYFTFTTAISNHITGWVRNCSDGTVEFEAQGQESDLNHFLTLIEKGQFPAKVTNLKTDSIEVDLREGKFKILN